MTDQKAARAAAQEEVDKLMEMLAQATDIGDWDPGPVGFLEGAVSLAIYRAYELGFWRGVATNPNVEKK